MWWRIEDIIGVTVLPLTHAYLGPEFIQFGYHVNNDYDDEQLREEPSPKVLIDRVQTNILAVYDIETDENRKKPSHPFTWSSVPWAVLANRSNCMTYCDISSSNGFSKSQKSPSMICKIGYIVLSLCHIYWSLEANNVSFCFCIFEFFCLVCYLNKSYNMSILFSTWNIIYLFKKRIIYNLFSRCVVKSEPNL